MTNIISSIRHYHSPTTDNKTISKAYSHGKVIREVVKSTVTAWIHLRSCQYHSPVIKEGAITQSVTLL